MGLVDHEMRLQALEATPPGEDPRVDGLIDDVQDLTITINNLIKSKTVTGTTSSSGSINCEVDVSANIPVFGYVETEQHTGCFVEFRVDGYATLYTSTLDNGPQPVKNTDVVLTTYYFEKHE